MKTYECKISDEQTTPLIKKLNALFGMWSRKLFVRLYGNPVKDRNQLKRNFMQEFGISSTHYNSIKNHIDGVMSSRKELAEEQYKETQNRIKQTKKTIGKLEKTILEHYRSIARINHYNKQLAIHKKRLELSIKSKKPRKPNRNNDKITIREQRKLIDQARFKCHQKKRRLAILEKRAESLSQESHRGRWPICFGTKGLFRKQNFLKENGYENHTQWLSDWHFNRSNQSFWLGDSTENGRNRNAKLSIEKGTLRLSMPNCLRDKYGSFITVTGIEFDPRAREDIEARLSSCDDFKPSPLSYRLLERQKISHDKLGIAHKKRQLYLQVSVDIPPIPIETRRDLGAIGIDLNHDHLAIGEVDLHGNPVHGFKLDFNIEGKSSGQVAAIFGDHIRDIVAYAKLKNKPIAIEKLDFRNKKAALRETHGPRAARILSNLAYIKFKSFLESRCSKQGVDLLKVNPAFSSILGAYNYFGLNHLYSSHQMAAFVLARRGLGFKDSLKCVYNERNHTALLRTVSIAPDKAPPTFEAWIRSGEKRHRWSLLRRYYGTYSLFVKHLNAKHSSANPGKIRVTDAGFGVGIVKGRNFQSRPPRLLCPV